MALFYLLVTYKLFYFLILTWNENKDESSSLNSLDEKVT